MSAFFRELFGLKEDQMEEAQKLADVANVDLRTFVVHVNHRKFLQQMQNRGYAFHTNGISYKPRSVYAEVE